MLVILVDRKKAVPEGLLKTAALLHDAALLVRPILSNVKVAQWPAQHFLAACAPEYASVRVSFKCKAL